jgi:hypothetical protein
MMESTTHTPTPRADTQTATLPCSAAQLFDFLSDPENLPRWAVGFCRGIRPNGDEWLVRTAHGEVGLRYVTDRALGVIDYHMSPAPGVEATAFSRVVPNGDGAVYVFTQLQPPGMPDGVFAGQATALTEELRVLEAVVRAQIACALPAPRAA